MPKDKDKEKPDKSPYNVPPHLREAVQAEEQRRASLVPNVPAVLATQAGQVQPQAGSSAAQHGTVPSHQAATHNPVHFPTAAPVQHKPEPPINPGPAPIQAGPAASHPGPPATHPGPAATHPGPAKVQAGTAHHAGSPPIRPEASSAQQGSSARRGSLPTAQQAANARLGQPQTAPPHQAPIVFPKAAPARPRSNSLPKAAQKGSIPTSGAAQAQPQPGLLQPKAGTTSVPAPPALAGSEQTKSVPGAPANVGLLKPKIAPVNLPTQSGSLQPKGRAGSTGQSGFAPPKAGPAPASTTQAKTSQPKPLPTHSIVTLATDSQPKTVPAPVSTIPAGTVQPKAGQAPALLTQAGTSQPKAQPKPAEVNQVRALQSKPGPAPYPATQPGALHPQSGPGSVLGSKFGRTSVHQKESLIVLKAPPVLPTLTDSSQLKHGLVPVQRSVSLPKFLGQEVPPGTWQTVEKHPGPPPQRRPAILGSVPGQHWPLTGLSPPIRSKWTGVIAGEPEPLNLKPVQPRPRVVASLFKSSPIPTIPGGPVRKPKPAPVLTYPGPYEPVAEPDWNKDVEVSEPRPGHFLVQVRPIVVAQRTTTTTVFKPLYRRRPKYNIAPHSTVGVPLTAQSIPSKPRLPPRVPPAKSSQIILEATTRGEAPRHWPASVAPVDIPIPRPDPAEPKRFSIDLPGPFIPPYVADMGQVPRKSRVGFTMAQKSQSTPELATVFSTPDQVNKSILSPPRPQSHALYHPLAGSMISQVPTASSLATAGPSSHIASGSSSLTAAGPSSRTAAGQPGNSSQVKGEPVNPRQVASLPVLKAKPYVPMALNFPPKPPPTLTGKESPLEIDPVDGKPRRKQKLKSPRRPRERKRCCGCFRKKLKTSSPPSREATCIPFIKKAYPFAPSPTRRQPCIPISCLPIRCFQKPYQFLGVSKKSIKPKISVYKAHSLPAIGKARANIAKFRGKIVKPPPPVEVILPPKPIRYESHPDGWGYPCGHTNCRRGFKCVLAAAPYKNPLIEKPFNAQFSIEIPEDHGPSAPPPPKTLMNETLTREVWEYPCGHAQEIVICHIFKRFARSPRLESPKYQRQFFRRVCALKLYQYLVAILCCLVAKWGVRPYLGIRFPNGTYIASWFCTFIYFLGFIRQFLVRRYGLGRHHPQATYVYWFQTWCLATCGLIGSINQEDAKADYYFFFISVFFSFFFAYLFLIMYSKCGECGPKCRVCCRLDGRTLLFTPAFVCTGNSGIWFLLNMKASKQAAASALYHYLGCAMLPWFYSVMVTMWECHEITKIIKGWRVPLGENQHLYVCNHF